MPGSMTYMLQSCRISMRWIFISHTHGGKLCVQFAERRIAPASTGLLLCASSAWVMLHCPATALLPCLELPPSLLPMAGPIMESVLQRSTLRIMCGMPSGAISATRLKQGKLDMLPYTSSCYAVLAWPVAMMDTASEATK